MWLEGERTSPPPPRSECFLRTRPVPVPGGRLGREAIDVKIVSRWRKHLMIYLVLMCYYLIEYT
jgi:hypothetical protein